MEIARDGEFRRWKVEEKRSSEDGEFRKWRVHEMESLGDAEFSRCDVYEMGSTRYGIFRDGKFTR